jgi:hypothetical protein
MQVFLRFGEKYCLHIQSTRISQKQPARNKQVGRICLLGLPLGIAYGDSMFFRNVGEVLSDYAITAVIPSNPKKHTVVSVQL